MAEEQGAVITLYTGDHCPLCDKAKAIIYPLLGDQWRLREVSVSQDEALKQAYGLRIPVVLLPDGTEKGWPFTTGQVRRLMEAHHT